MKTLSRLQTKTKLMLMRMGLFGGLAWVIADKIAHALGLGCLGF